MKKTILILGEELRLNQNFLDYIFRICGENSLEFDEIKFANKIDKDLPFFIENLIEKCEFLWIFASGENYGVIAKILSTLSGDLLELKDDTLAPSMAQEIAKNSFLMQIKDCKINVLKAVPFTKLPQILAKNEIISKIFYIFNFEISDIKSRIEPFLGTYNVSVAISQYSKFLVAIKVKENEFGQIDAFMQSVKTAFDNFVIENENFIEFIVKKLAQKGAKITFAESCTAGLIASKLGEISGASEVFDGSFVTYANKIKNAWLGVENRILNDFGAVSKECVSQMLDGALARTKADFALAVSGIAGPLGGTAQKPVGTIFIGAAQKGDKKIVGEFHINGDRNFIRDEAANIAFCLLLKLRGDLFFDKI